MKKLILILSFLPAIMSSQTEFLQFDWTYHYETNTHNQITPSPSALTTIKDGVVVTVQEYRGVPKYSSFALNSEGELLWLNQDQRSDNYFRNQTLDADVLYSATGRGLKSIDLENGMDIWTLEQRGLPGPTIVDDSGNVLESIVIRRQKFLPDPIWEYYFYLTAHPFGSTDTIWQFNDLDTTKTFKYPLGGVSLEDRIIYHYYYISNDFTQWFQTVHLSNNGDLLFSNDFLIDEYYLDGYAVDAFGGLYIVDDIGLFEVRKLDAYGYEEYYYVNSKHESFDSVFQNDYFTWQPNILPNGELFVGGTVVTDTSTIKEVVLLDSLGSEKWNFTEELPFVLGRVDGYMIAEPIDGNRFMVCGSLYDQELNIKYGYKCSLLDSNGVVLSTTSKADTINKTDIGIVDILSKEDTIYLFGDYQYIDSTSSGGCFVQKLVYSADTLVSSSTEINQREESILFYPNPTSGYVYFDQKRVSELESVLTIYDAKGQTISDVQKSDHIDLSQQPDGVYFISYRIDNASFLEKVVKFSL